MKKLITILIAISIGIILMFSNKTKIKASTITNWSSIESRIWYDQQGTNTASSWSTGSTHTFSPSYPVTSIQWRVKASGGLSNENTYTLTFGYTPTPDAISVNNVYIRREGDYPNETITCKEWQRNTSTGRYTKECTFTPGYNYNSNDYLFIRIIFNESYLSSIQSYISGFNERESTNAVITDQTNNIINNQEQNTQEIINNNNQNTQDIIDNNYVCENQSKIYTLSDKDTLNYGFLTSSGSISSSTTTFYTDYIRIKKDNTYNLSTTLWTLGNTSSYCLYNNKKVKISCSIYNNATNVNITPSEDGYIRLSLYLDNNNNTKITFKGYICKQGSQALQDTLDQDAEYNTEGNQIEGKQEMDDYKQAEENVLDNLDFSAVDNLDITINANASNFIWQIVDRLRQINSKIILLFTSVLGLGLVKLILNR